MKYFIFALILFSKASLFSCEMLLKWIEEENTLCEIELKEVANELQSCQRFKFDTDNRSEILTRMHGEYILGRKFALKDMEKFINENMCD